MLPQRSQTLKSNTLFHCFCNQFLFFLLLFTLRHACVCYVVLCVLYIYILRACTCVCVCIGKSKRATVAVCCFHPSSGVQCTCTQQCYSFLPLNPISFGTGLLVLLLLSNNFCSVAFYYVRFKRNSIKLWKILGNRKRANEPASANKNCIFYISVCILHLSTSPYNYIHICTMYIQPSYLTEYLKAQRYQTNSANQMLPCHSVGNSVESLPLSCVVVI